MNPTEALARLRRHGRPVTVMEVCGTHTAAIARHGLRSLLPSAIRLVSGPGCPVCVTPPDYIDRLVGLARTPGHRVVSFGDLFRVRGSRESLAEAKAAGAAVTLVYSPLEALPLARDNPDATVVVAAVGFETTVPVYAVLVDRALREGLENIRLATALKTMPAALDHLCRHEAVDAFICPGHVTTVIGSDAYRDLCRRYGKPFVVAGFEPEHIIAALYEITRQRERGVGEVRNLYPSVVGKEGQIRARELVERFFTAGPAVWRGIGALADSGLRLRPEFGRLACDAEGEGVFSLPEGCRCGEVMLGRITPEDCPLYGGACTPEEAVGPCMVSSEGACAIWALHEDGAAR